VDDRSILTVLAARRPLRVPGLGLAWALPDRPARRERLGWLTRPGWVR
jgi:hypothetical protein